MRRLILMRHAEAESSDKATSDRARVLLPIGVAAAVRCGQEMRALGFSPDLILCSDATRAVMTMDSVIRGGNFTGITPKVLGMLYLAEPDVLISRCLEVDDTIENLLVIGHNPGWSEAATQLSGTPLSLGTAQAALLEHPGDSWVTALHDRWRLKGIIP